VNVHEHEHEHVKTAHDNTTYPNPVSFWSATMPRGPHPFPSRTRSLSLAGRMVLLERSSGRVRRRRPLTMKKARIEHHARCGLFSWRARSAGVEAGAGHTHGRGHGHGTRARASRQCPPRTRTRDPGRTRARCTLPRSRPHPRGNGVARCTLLCNAERGCRDRPTRLRFPALLLSRRIFCR
jgi:hypothetical protein